MSKILDNGRIHEEPEVIQTREDLTLWYTDAHKKKIEVGRFFLEIDGLYTFIPDDGAITGEDLAFTYRDLRFIADKLEKLNAKE